VLCRDAELIAGDQSQQRSSGARNELWVHWLSS